MSPEQLIDLKENYLTVKQAVDNLIKRGTNLSKSYITRKLQIACKNGSINAQKFGFTWAFTKKEFKKYIENNL